ncbi:helix-turn-helix domain-containing protein [Burkholderia ubonensis]
MPFYLWTRESVAQLIEREYSITVSKWTAGRYLKAWGMSAQKPVRRAYERKDEAIERWLNEDYPTEPLLGLRVQIFEIGVLARGEEGFSNVADRAFHAPLLIAASDGDRPRLEAVVTGEREQRRMETDRVAEALEHGRFQVVAQQDSWQSAPRVERADVAAQEVLHVCIEEEAQVDVARVQEHHHERHQWPARTTNLDVAEVPPSRPGPARREACVLRLSARKRSRRISRNLRLEPHVRREKLGSW